MAVLETILAALVAGATATVENIASDAIKTAYDKLKSYLSQKFSADSLVLLEKNPEKQAYRAALSTELADTGAAQDADLAKMAQDFIELLQRDMPSSQAMIRNITAESLTIGDITAHPGGQAGIEGANIAGHMQVGNLTAGDKGGK